MLHQLATVCLGPILLAQGAYTRRVTPILPEPPGERAGEVGQGPPLRLLLIGDSAGAGVGAPSQAAALAGQVVAGLAATRTVRWRLIARTGATTAGTLAHLAKTAPEPWDVVVTSLGVNDVVGGVAVGAWRNQQARLVAALRERFGARRILLTAVPPMHLFPALPQPLRWYLGAQARRYNQALARWAAGQPGCEVVTFAYTPDPALMAADGFHPGPRLYALWGAEVARRIAAAPPPA